MEYEKDPNNEKARSYYPTSSKEPTGEKFTYHSGNLKGVNPTYTTFRGNYGSWNIDKTQLDWFCLWGHLRICYDSKDMLDGWKHISLHGFKFGYTYTPVKKLLWNFDYHFAFNKKWPFVKIGFTNIWPLIDKDKF